MQKLWIIELTFAQRLGYHDLANVAPFDVFSLHTSLILQVPQFTIHIIILECTTNSAYLPAGRLSALIRKLPKTGSVHPWSNKKKNSAYLFVFLFWISSFVLFFHFAYLFINMTHNYILLLHLLTKTKNNKETFSLLTKYTSITI